MRKVGTECFTNKNFPEWKEADTVLAQMSRDIGAHIYMHNTDPECPLILSESQVVGLLIPWQWLSKVPEDYQYLFKTLYNEFATEIFEEIHMKEILEKYEWHSINRNTRFECRLDMYNALEKYCLYNDIRDQFLKKMGCEHKQLSFLWMDISGYVKEEDKQWVVPYQQ